MKKIKMKHIFIWFFRIKSKVFKEMMNSMQYLKSETDENNLIKRENNKDVSYLDVW